MKKDEYEIRQQICETGRRIYERRMVASNDGNISVKLGDNEYLCTPTGVSKGFMTPDCICRVDGKGNILQENGEYRPSSEIWMHMRVYEKRPDVGAVVHAHPVFATAFAASGMPLAKHITAESVVSLGCVPLAPYATPSTAGVPDSIEPFLENFDQVLLENHGALTWGKDLITAYHRMESVEFYAELLYRTKQLGGGKELQGEELKKLYEVRKKTGLTGRHPFDAFIEGKKPECSCCGSCLFKEILHRPPRN